MKKYLNWDTKILEDSLKSDFKTIDELYANGYVATRVDKGVFNKTRSVRIRLADWQATSENRRVLRKMADCFIAMQTAPLPYSDYHWSIHKLARDFYTTKFGEDTFSANKIKELMTDRAKSNFNTVLIYKGSESKASPIGYTIALQTDTLLHYSYPFYNLDIQKKLPSIGLGMMTLAIEYAKAAGLTYIYLGSLQRPSDSYKLQFEGMEWFDGEKWQTNLSPLKEILSE
jgi:arginyl-tRNA--protein-N-Asp/Glu arginylyltransferase